MKWARLAILATLFAAWTPRAFATDVAVRISSREVYVNEEFQIDIVVTDGIPDRPPQFPQIPNTVMRGPMGPSRNTSATYVGNKMSYEVTVTYSYFVTARTAGRVTIPALTIPIDGREYRTAPVFVSIVASESDDLLSVRVRSDRSAIYIGESVDVSLEIWLRPYRDQNVRMDASDMLRRIDVENSQWGVFEEEMLRLQSREKRWQYREDIQTDANGVDRVYNVYIVNTRFTPTAAGPLDVGDVRVNVSYPVRTQRRRTMFALIESPYEIVRAKRLTASPQPSGIEVMAVPLKGRPEYFNGAVGNFDFAASADVANVRVREPFELTFSIRGLGNLDRVPLPPLSDLDELTMSFKVPTDAVAGTIHGQEKTFKVKVSATSDDVSEVPSIPFAYFDPTTERFVTRWSDPIPLGVEPGEQVPLEMLTGAGDAEQQQASRLTETGVGLRANYVEADALLADHSFAPGVDVALILAGSPLVYLLAVMVRARQVRLERNPGLVRRRQAAAKALAALRRASSSASVDSRSVDSRSVDLRSGDSRSGDSRSADSPATACSVALIRYVADRFNAPAGLTAQESIELLQTHDVPDDCVRQLADVLGRCEQARYTGGVEAGACDLIDQARHCIQLLERARA